MSGTPRRLPEWLKGKFRQTDLRAVKSMLRGHGLATVCEEARCPNKSECFKHPTATFMILGSTCTRSCGFCSVDKGGPYSLPDADEPRRLAEAAGEMGLRYVVITSVTRDDLPDGGSGHFAACISEVRGMLPDAGIEVLTPDFKGSEDALGTVLAASPDVFNHNVETVPSLYATVRPQADYARSIDLLARASRIAPHVRTKSGLMLGLGENMDEVVEVLGDLRKAGCSFVTIGQYLKPAKGGLEVKEYIHPDAFEELGQRARGMGFGFVACAPLVRSSMNAEEMYRKGSGE